MRNNAAPNLIRHRSRRYYARAFAGGKEVWKSLLLRNLNDNLHIKPSTRDHSRQRPFAIHQKLAGVQSNRGPQDHAGCLQGIGKRIGQDGVAE
jgi:hypothetical protein